MSSEQDQQQQKKKGEGIKKIDYQNKTPVGHKKDVSGEMEPAYYPAAVEAAWYSWWEKSNFFQADSDANNKREKFVIMLPPPNVTGSLHLGHTLTVAIQDSIVRYHRMQGKNVLYLPGTDHAGIATQVVVEKKLQKEQQLSRHDLGREEFLKKVWVWKEQYGSRICEQLRRTGASLDWSRECFTMDEPRSKAVNEAFVRMYEKGYIFRDTRLVNWCCHLRTAISNIEVDHKEFTQPKKIPVPGHDPKKTYEFGYIWEFAYKIENSDEEIVVATTRPETMLGDTAIAVHPEEEKYKHLHGKFAVHPFNGRRLPIVCDPILVEKGFGTGAVKVTPAHDHNDFLCGKRNNLEFINILNDDGTLNANAAPFAGLMRYEARYQVTKALDDKKLLRAKKPHNLNVGVCSRSGDVIEPMIKPQWFVNCKELAKRAVELSESGDLMIYPRNEQATWKRWLDNIQDWCISRQLWWGHRIPAYYISIQGQAKGDVADGKYWVVARTKEEAIKIAAERFGVEQALVTLSQDEDVLDTWFSSGLFPFSTLGWPDNTADLAQFYPGHLLETGMDILFFWVARMVMMGLALMDKLPFTSVFLHSIVRDKNGKKMSKSTGNVIDPIDVIEGIDLLPLNEKLQSYNLNEAELKNAVKLQAEQFPKGIPECGTDALRFCLLNYCTMGKDINLDVQRVFGYRTFCNKMWNATRFAFINLQGFKPKSHDELPDMNTVSFMDRWILSRLNNAIKIANESLLNYDFYTHTNALYDFFLKELCDVYLEAIKPIMYGEGNEQAKKAAQITLYTCLEQSYRLMHPSMPFITEELWQRLPGRDLYPKHLESIMLNAYPSVQPNWTDADVESKTELVMEIVRKIRSIKAVYTIKQKPNVFIKCDAALSSDLLKQTLNIQTLAVCGEVKINEAIPEGCGVQIVNAQCEVHILLKGLIDFNAELSKLQKQQQKIQKALEELEKKMKSDKYQKVPPSIQEEDRAKVEDSKTELQKLEDSIATLNKFVSK